MNLHTQQHLSLSDQTWPNMSVTHGSLCPSVKEEESTFHRAFLQEAGSPWRLGDPLSPWQPAPLCLHSIYSSPVPAPASCESANMLPFYCLWRATRWEACVLNHCWLMKCIWRPKASCAPFHSWNLEPVNEMNEMQALLYELLLCSHLRLHRCAGSCWDGRRVYVVKPCRGSSSWKHMMRRGEPVHRHHWPGPWGGVRLEYWPHLAVKNTLSLAMA